MRAIVIESADRFVWAEVPNAEPKRGEVVIKVNTAGINRADLLQAAGHYPPPVGESEILGLEVSGVITDIGEDVAEWIVGQHVCALLAGGGYAEYVAVPAQQVMAIPDGISLQDAAALPEVACTVWSNLAMAAQLQPGELLLIHGGASGIGSHAIQVAKQLGARVAITAGSAAKLEISRELGADILICYRDEDFVDRIQASTNGHGADVILDVMGAAYLDRNLDALALNGRLAIIGMQGGIKAELNIGKLVGKRLQVIGTALRSRPTEGSNGKGAIIDAVVESVWPMISSGAVQPVVGARYPVQDAAEAHRALKSGQTYGKILLTVSD